MVPERAALIFATVRVPFGDPMRVCGNYYGGVTAYGVASTVEADLPVEDDHSENFAEHPFRQLGNQWPGRFGEESFLFLSPRLCEQRKESCQGRRGNWALLITPTVWDRSQNSTRREQ